MLVLATLFVILFVYGGWKASLNSMLEVSARRKNWEAGTHDYYGNKL